MIHLNMTKTKFLRLLEEKTRGLSWVQMPKETKTVRFWKVKRQWDYFLEWRTNEGFFRAFLAMVVGKPKLSLELIKDGSSACKVLDLDIEQLLEDGMAIDPENSIEYLTNAERERLKARFARITAKLKGG